MKMPTPCAGSRRAYTRHSSLRVRRAATLASTPIGWHTALTWRTSEAPAWMNVKLRIGSMELMYTASDTNDQDLQDRMTKVLPWLAEMMVACEVPYSPRQQAATQPTPPPPPEPAPQRPLEAQG